MRQDCASGYLCPRLPAYGRGADVRYLPVAEEDEAYQDHKDVVQEVDDFIWRIISGSRYQYEF